MIFSQHIGFGAFAMLFLQRCKECRTLALEGVGTEMGLSRAQTRKVLDALTNNGLLVRSGRPTLYRLVRPLNEVHVGDLLDALEPPPAPVACQQNPNRLCQTFQELWALHERVRNSVRSITVSTLARAMRAACESRASDGSPNAGALPQSSGFVADGDSAWVSCEHRVCCDPVGATVQRGLALPIATEALPVAAAGIFAGNEATEIPTLRAN